MAQLAFASGPQKLTQTGTQEGVNSLAGLLKKLESVHKVSFVYQKELLENKTFSGTVNETDKLETVLDRVLTPVNLRFKKLKGGGYTILPRKSQKSNSPETQLLNSTTSPYTEQNTIRESGPGALLAKADNQLVSTARPADIVVKGRVTDSEKGEPIPGASIVLKGANKGDQHRCQWQLFHCRARPRVGAGVQLRWLRKTGNYSR